ncbi:MAG: phosphoribosylanthranilate isomerase [Rhodanobacteraceae bacterium]
MYRTRVKICGITRVEDALLACELGADAIGLVMTPTSPRCVSIERARAIRDALPAFVDAVVVLVDAEAREVERVVSVVHPDALQFHGHETPACCIRAGLPYIKAFSMNEPVAGPLEDEVERYATACAILLDGRRTASPGGEGMFDWQAIPRSLPRPLILAGGIDETNVAAAIEQVAPYAVDISSGVESSPGIKDAGKLRAFFDSVASAQENVATEKQPSANERQ